MYNITIKQLLSSYNGVLEVIGDMNECVCGVDFDSRHIQSGFMFVAINGTTVDGHTFIQAVVESGAKAIVCERLPEVIVTGVCYVRVRHSASALGYIASEWYGNPSQKLILTGVTGTNGKTTTATLLYEMARYCGYKAGLLSTVCNYVDEKPIAATQTTPDSLSINRLLHDMVEAGCRYAFMEVSSHAAVQCRIDGLKFKCGIFTNLTRDHLDYHKTTRNYIAAKKRFFDMLPSDASALVNIDDANGKVMVQNTKAHIYTYSMRSMADFRGKIIESRLDGTLLDINGKELEVVFVGAFNAYNLLAVYGASSLIDLPKDDLLVNLSRLVPVAGRFQIFRSPKDYSVVVDYAHTPDAIKNVLSTIREVQGTRRIITVVGAGGNRDKGKRPIMAAEALKASDMVILTSDNPRDEDPIDIIAEMHAGVDTKDAMRVIDIPDRRQAIMAAMQFAQKGDVVVVAGKGHENYQEIKGVKHHFDDREVVTQIIKNQEITK